MDPSVGIEAQISLLWLRTAHCAGLLLRTQGEHHASTLPGEPWQWGNPTARSVSRFRTMHDLID